MISVATKCELVKLACERPPKLAFTTVWTQQCLADTLHRQTGKRISRSTVQRVLSAEGLRPHRVRQWLHSPDPLFREKVAQVCGLYLAPPPGSVVVCIDEKPMQALGRKHPTQRQPDASVRREFEYKRYGTCCLLASFNVQTGEVLGRVVKRRTGDALVSFLDQIAKHHPGRQIYVVWDNLNIHFDGKAQRWTAFNLRHNGRFHFAYTPLHASWVEPGGNLVLNPPATRDPARVLRRRRSDQSGRSGLYLSLEPRRSAPVSMDLHRPLRALFCSARCLRRSVVPIPVTDTDVSAVTKFLAAPAWRHLRCRKRANTIALESGPKGDPTPHLRLRKLSAKNWGVDAATHTGRWERMPFQGPLLEVLPMVAESFPWLLAPLDGPSTNF